VECSTNKPGGKGRYDEVEGISEVSKIPPTDRLYIYVTYWSAENGEDGDAEKRPAVVSRHWTVGKMVDTVLREVFPRANQMPGVRSLP